MLGTGENVVEIGKEDDVNQDLCQRVEEEGEAVHEGVCECAECGDSNHKVDQRRLETYEGAISQMEAASRGGVGGRVRSGWNGFAVGMDLDGFAVRSVDGST